MRTPDELVRSIIDAAENLKMTVNAIGEPRPEGAYIPKRQDYDDDVRQFDNACEDYFAAKRERERLIADAVFAAEVRARMA